MGKIDFKKILEDMKHDTIIDADKIVPEYEKQSHYYGDIKEDAPIFRMLKADYVIDMIRERNLRVCTVLSWEDTWESFFLKSAFENEGRVVDGKPLIKDLFGQSWTYQWPESSDILWGRYNNHEDFSYVMIQSSTSKLRTRIRKVFGEEQLCYTYLERVAYAPQDKINEALCNLKTVSPMRIQENIVKSLYTKRSQFAYEDEFRLMIMDSKKDGEDGTVFSKFMADNFLNIPLGDEQFIDAVYLDPRLISRERNKQVIDMKNKLSSVGFDEKKVHVSKLFDFTPIKVSLV